MTSLASRPDLFADFNGLPSEDAKTEFYQHDANWSNRMILGDSLQVMASLAEREGTARQGAVHLHRPALRHQIQLQLPVVNDQPRRQRTAMRQHITREPEQVKAFRDTWRDGIHSYLTYLRDRLTVARDLLAESGSVFVQIGDENVHRVRAVMEEVFGENQPHECTIDIQEEERKCDNTESVIQYVVWYCKSRDDIKVRNLYEQRRTPDEETKFNTLVTEPMILRRK